MLQDPDTVQLFTPSNRASSDESAMNLGAGRGDDVIGEIPGP
jgi:hypothetical protein